MSAPHLGMRSLVFGVGINDANYSIAQYPYYKTWKNMLKRCYSKAYQAKYPSYIGCSVHTEWYSFIDFKEWMERQPWIGNELDKDIRNPGNKIYSSANCCFVPMALNRVLYTEQRGQYPQGVSTKGDKFRARINIDGKSISIGSFDTAQEAAVAYTARKKEYLTDLAYSQSDRKLKHALLQHARLL